MYMYYYVYYLLSSCSWVETTGINRYHSNDYANQAKRSKIIDLEREREISVSNIIIEESKEDIEGRDKRERE